MRIIIAGGTGFIGRVIVQGLIEDGHEVTIVRRPSTKSQAPSGGTAKTAYIDLENPIAESALEGDAVINVVGIIREFPRQGVTFHRAHVLVTRNLVDFASQNGIKRYLQMSALGAKPESRTAYKRSKYEAENYVRESGLDWTIFRPSVVIGPGGGLVKMLSGMIKNLPVVPLIGTGNDKIQPVYVGDVSLGFRRALTNEASIGKTFEFGGPEIMTFSRMIDIIGEALGRKRVLKFPQPIWFLRPLAAVFDRFSWFPLSNEQMTMLKEQNYTADKTYFETWGIEPVGLREGLAKFLKQSARIE